MVVEEEPKVTNTMHEERSLDNEPGFSCFYGSPTLYFDAFNRE